LKAGVVSVPLRGCLIPFLKFYGDVQLKNKPKKILAKSMFATEKEVQNDSTTKNRFIRLKFHLKTWRF
jgi:hypothetical protein